MIRFARYLSKRLRNAFLHLVERVANRMYEGPAPPKRLKERVQLFQLFHPNATPAQWAQFAERIANNCYREGFVRGFEWEQRGWEGPGIEPEQLAEMRANNWSVADYSPDWSRALTTGYDPRSPLASMSAEERAQFVALMQTPSHFPVEISLDNYEGPPHGFPGIHHPPTEDDDE